VIFLFLRIPTPPFKLHLNSILFDFAENKKSVALVKDKSTN
jgi:hypothetical protein